MDLGTAPVLPATVRDALEGFDVHVTAEVVERIAALLDDLCEADGWGSMPHGYEGCSSGCFHCIRDWLRDKQED